jgi:hypothetical protein
MRTHGHSPNNIRAIIKPVPGHPGSRLGEIMGPFTSLIFALSADGVDGERHRPTWWNKEV